MDFPHYAEAAAELVNSEIDSPEALRAYLVGRPWLAERVRPGDVRALCRLQAELAAVVDASDRSADAEVVERVNRLLAQHPIRPRISGHDATSWHLHVNDADAVVAEVLAAEALFGVTLLVTEVGATRLGRCSAPDCHRAFVDTSTNHSRRFCSTRCATRTNVAHYRHRRRVAEDVLVTRPAQIGPG